MVAWFSRIVDTASTSAHARDARIGRPRKGVVNGSECRELGDEGLLLRIGQVRTSALRWRDL